MVKNKTIKSFLMLGVILFSVCGFAGCSNPSNNESENEANINLYDEAIQCYFEKYIKVNRPNASIDDVWLFQYLGTYNDSFVGIFLDKENCVFIDRLNPYFVEELNFSYSEGYVILVYNKGNFYMLHEAFLMELISYNDLLEIHNDYKE